MSTEHFDLIGVGTGAAAIATRKFARDGRKVALIDNRPPGGTCSLRGCAPKKILATGAEAFDLARRLNGKGLLSENLGSSWSDLRAFMKDYIDPIPENNKRIYAKEGATFIEGTARFISPETMAVQEPDGTEQILSADRFVLTTGARARPLPFPGNEHVTVSDDFFELEPLPRRILFLGGGFISMEFAHIASPYGSECHIVERRDHILTGFESFLTEKLLEHSIKHHGISIHLNSEVESIKRQQDGLHVQLTSSRQSIIVDAVIHGAGRIPNIEELDLAAGEVEATAHGIQVDEYFNSTTNPRVYAAGDCADTGVPHLTLVAGAEGSIVYRNLVEGNTARADYRGIATIVFTLPQMASVGMTEHDARAAELDIELREQDTARWFTNRILNWGVGGFKIIIDRDSDRLLGAHFLGHECEEFINVFALAIRHGITREELKQTLWGHPSNGSDMRRILGTQS